MVVLVGISPHLADLLTADGDQEVRFDAVVGRNALTRCADKTAALLQMRHLATARLGGWRWRRWSPARPSDSRPWSI